MEASLKRVRMLMNLVGIPPEEFAYRFPDELSGGQQQRVGVARALAADPAYLLMDEPFGPLDALTGEALRRELLALKKRTQKIIIFVIHEIFVVTCAFATGGRIAANNLEPLEDDRQFFPPYYAAPVIRQGLLQMHPELDGVLSLVEGLLDNPAMQR